MITSNPMQALSAQWLNGFMPAHPQKHRTETGEAVHCNPSELRRYPASTGHPPGSVQSSKIPKLAGHRVEMSRLTTNAVQRPPSRKAAFCAKACRRKQQLHQLGRGALQQSPCRPRACIPSCPTSWETRGGTEERGPWPQRAGEWTVARSPDGTSPLRSCTHHRRRQKTQQPARSRRQGIPSPDVQQAEKAPRTADRWPNAMTSSMETRHSALRSTETSVTSCCLRPLH
mmetsp:Transcript_82320/g.266537  ORF Transcript_82320/g.266537 Transcript_82320/m.266537 type:complete len:229 (+) Transcript_82320:304-990(+)